MKVLFAVNNEEISEAIVKKYQKKYKEIISYKNVYYFNAILKEIQKDKSYNRIVVSEDLEQFTNSSYEQMDKFIFEKLDSISDETSSAKSRVVKACLYSYLEAHYDETAQNNNQDELDELISSSDKAIQRHFDKFKR